MRSSLIAASYLLTMGMYAPAAPPQAQMAPPQPQAQTELVRQGKPPPDIRRDNASVTANTIRVLGQAKSHQPSGGPATDTQPRNQQSGNRQLPQSVGLLLALALLDGAGAAPQGTPQSAIH
jgi:hypothetical protein